jgi:hypothetical protein
MSALAILQNRGERREVRVRALEAIVGQMGAWAIFGPMDKLRYVNPATGVVEKEVEVVRVSLRGNGSYEATRGTSPVTDGTKERVKAALRNLLGGPDDPYILLAVKQALELVTPERQE